MLSKLAKLILMIFAFLTAAPVFAHGGSLDANGCHTNRKTGDYHCHRAPAAPPTAPPPSVNPHVQPVIPQGGSSVYYKNCSQARAAVAAPIRRGEPGYGSHLDRDGDGIACE
ncbi:MAG: excalibur calcium-binding domain-containing protein [Permianibacter sp.]